MAQSQRSQAVLVRVAPDRGEVGADQWVPATVSGGAGWKQFKPFSNSNGSKIFQFFQILTDPKGTFLSSKKLK
jgi:hypothetical protein